MWRLISRQWSKISTGRKQLKSPILGEGNSRTSPDLAQIRSQTEVINIHELSPTPISRLMDSTLKAA